MTACVASTSSRKRSSSRLASVGNISVWSTPSSSINSTRGCGDRNAGMHFIGSPMSSRYDLPSGLPLRKYSSCAPGRATTSKVGLGMNSLIVPFTTIFVRPLTCT